MTMWDMKGTASKKILSSEKQPKPKIGQLKKNMINNFPYIQHTLRFLIENHCQFVNVSSK